MSHDATFAAGWLALREGADHRARAGALTETMAAEGRRRGWTRALDLGTGTGSNLRYLGPRLSWIRSWTVVDHDPHLLSRVPEPASGAALERIPGDLDREGLAAVRTAELVTASALLDLVSEAWLRKLVDGCRSAGAGALLALTYDGTTRWEAEDAGDAEIRRAVNRHQERDKGLGAALGPSATGVAERLFRSAGYQVSSAPSPWILEGPEDAPLALELTRGWARAASELESVDPSVVDDWLRRRAERIAGGHYRIEVGHRDLVALPRG